MQRRTGGPFSRLLASRSPVPADHHRYPINDDRYAGVGPWRHNTGLRLMPVNDTPDEPFPRTTFLVRPSNLLMACASLLAPTIGVLGRHSLLDDGTS
ncbi:hypothetical protein CA13_09760 [Planctomycetes bacterium CA13]|uniref:Uncharacterized protein n=1 Tax=Novipirellula herctigrandis TaxID=2527986 RepID=A0A5C5YX32_9BACT|nr:hypothetical protein CA13_09760 [Planctomycetes bacterium CA13]